MRCESYAVEALGKRWVLHVFDVEGEDDILAVPLRVDSWTGSASFQDSFQKSFESKGRLHLEASRCPACRPKDRDEWLSRFTDWVKDAYSAMSAHPFPMERRDLPEVVRISMEIAYRKDEEPESSDLN